ncbi:hypothetical protein NFI96_021157 [Prochilodus magdalenae]|nr:hypothetical protein NFI96_021157 [Prochilodus magdalenae]
MALVKKTQQRLYFLRILRKNNLQEKLLVSCYRSAIESVMTVSQRGTAAARQRKGEHCGES